MSELNTEDFIQVVNPPFSSPIVDKIVSLNNLRDRILHGSTSPQIFFQIKNIFQFVESLESARIEGNHTTLVDYVVERISNKTHKRAEHFQEMINIENAIQFIESYFHDNTLSAPINRIFIAEVHKMVVDGLTRDGDDTPGEYRKCNVSISGSQHKPPDYLQVSQLMDSLFSFVNKQDEQKYDLLKTAHAHHKFTWIHPFKNGNGRTVRLLTYAMLIKQGFNITDGRILNPTAVFCNDRDEYYKYLSKADENAKNGILAWYDYVLSGLDVEIRKIDQLLEFEFLTKNILLPALKDCLQVKKIIDEKQYKYLSLTLNSPEKQLVKAADFKQAFSEEDDVAVSRRIRKLKEIGMLASLKDKPRFYYLDLLKNSDFVRSIIHQLHEQELVPKNL